jgi:hypothetical protein
MGELSWGEGRCCWVVVAFGCQGGFGLLWAGINGFSFSFFGRLLLFEDYLTALGGCEVLVREERMDGAL